MATSFQAEITVYFNIVKRGKKIIFLCILASLIIGSAIEFSIKPVYRAQATLYYLQSQIPTGMLISFVNVWLEAAVQFVQSSIFTRDKCLEIIKEANLYPALVNKIPADDLVAQMQNHFGSENLYVSTASTSGANQEVMTGVKFYFEDSSPRKAFDVANILDSAYIENYRKFRESFATVTSSFLLDEQYRLKADPLAARDRPVDRWGSPRRRRGPRRGRRGSTVVRRRRDPLHDARAPRAPRRRARRLECGGCLHRGGGRVGGLDPRRGVPHGRPGRAARHQAGDPPRGHRRGAPRSSARAAGVRPRVTAAAPALSVMVLLSFARAHLAVDDPEGAHAFVIQAGDIIRHHPDLGVLPAEVEALRSAVASLAPTRRGGATSLTVAELRVLAFLPYYLSFKEIGQRLGVKETTVKSQATAIYGKLGAATRVEAVDMAVEAGLLAIHLFGLVDAVVDTTVCRGQVLMKDKKVLSLDEERISARSRELAPRMWQRL